MNKKMRSGPSASCVPSWNLARSWLKAKFTIFNEVLFVPIDAASLGIFRILFGLLLCIEFFLMSRETFPADYIIPTFHFTYPLFGFLGLKPLPQPYLWGLFHVLQLAAVGIMLGVFTRASLIVFTSVFGYFFLLESTVYTNHYYLIFLLSFLLCFGHSGSAFSLDNFFYKRTRPGRLNQWEVFLLRFQIFVVFFFGAIAKINADWLLHATPLYLNFVRHFSLLGYPLQERWIAGWLSWAGMLSDLGLAILLSMGRWYKLTFLWLCLFNGMNVVFFGLGIKTFPYMMVASWILFLPTPAVRRAIDWIRTRVSWSLRAGKHMNKVRAKNGLATQRRSMWIPGFFIVYTSMQLLFPLRHFLYRRDVQWTQEGADFSWRMMADHHDTEGDITVEDPRTKDVYLHSPAKLLTHKQLVMVNNPYMLLQYIHFLKEYLKQENGIDNPVIRADIKVSLNGRPFQSMYDADGDLSEVSYSPFKELQWIVPLKNK